MAEETKKEEGEKKAKGPVVCGHRNIHFVPALKDGKPVQSDVLVCTLEKGHAPVPVRRESVVNGKLTETHTMEVIHSSPYKTVRGGAEVDAVAYWSDGAEKPNAKQRQAR